MFHHDGRQIRNFEKAWDTARKAVGLYKLLVHDLRRSAARHLVRRGTSERVVMDILGHRTRRMLDRYNISSMDDLKTALRRASSAQEEIAAPPKVVRINQR